MKELEFEVKRLLAQQVYLLKRIEKLEKEVKGGWRSAPDSFYLDELQKEGEKIKI